MVCYSAVRGGESNSTLRSFIAIELPDSVRAALSEFQQEIQKAGADVRWVKPQGIHLTLKFLGEIAEKDVDRVINAVEGAGRNYSSFHLQIRGAGVFPNKKAPRVLWAAVEGNGILEGLQHEIEDALARLGFAKEDRKFSPHLTLGRFRSLSGREPLLERIELSKDREFGFMNVDMVSLMKSELGPAGAKYTRLAEIALKGSG